MATQPVSVHIFSPNCGHVHNTNCWCEPTRFYWLKREDGVDIYVVEHNDETTAPHEAVVMTRDIHHDWVTTTLEASESRKENKC